MSDGDQMRADFETWADAKCLPLTRINWKDGTTSEYAYTATFEAWRVWQVAYAAGRKAEQEAMCIQWEGAEATIAEVERLRAELATANTKTHAEKQNRTVEVDGAVRLLKESREEVERLRGELKVREAELAQADKWLAERSDAYGKTCSKVDQLQSELAATKAASVCPVRVKDCFSFGQNVEVECYCEDDADRLSGWLNERIKGGEG